MGWGGVGTRPRYLRRGGGGLAQGLGICGGGGLAQGIGICGGGGLAQGIGICGGGGGLAQGLGIWRGGGGVWIRTGHPLGFPLHTAQSTKGPGRHLQEGPDDVVAGDVAEVEGPRGLHVEVLLEVADGGGHEVPPVDAVVPHAVLRTPAEQPRAEHPLHVRERRAAQEGAVRDAAQEGDAPPLQGLGHVLLRLLVLLGDDLRGGGAGGEGRDALEAGEVPPPRPPGGPVPSHCLPDGKCRPALMAFVTDSDRPEPLQQPPPTARFWGRLRGPLRF